MAPLDNRPRLRPVDVVFVSNEEVGRALVLRDTEGIAPGPIMVPAALGAILAKFDGTRTVEEIAADAARELNEPLDVDLVERLAQELDQACLLDTPRAKSRRATLVRAFASADVREAAHAGGAYHGEAEALRRFIDDQCLAHAPPKERGGRIVGLCSPHMDLWRAAAGYGHAYRALADALSPEADTFVLLGTSHGAMRQPFAVCDKAFDTPLGPLEADHDLARELCERSTFDLAGDQYMHKTEHSIEFQAVFLRHVLGERARDVRIVPVLCGYVSLAPGRADAARAESFLSALTDVVGRNASRTVVIAGADFAHVGPRFGDPEPLNGEGQRALAERDGESIEFALRVDAEGFSRHVREDLESRRVCGLAPIYAMLRVISGSRGEKLHYAQCVDEKEGSIVSHASLAFFC